MINLNRLLNDYRLDPEYRDDLSLPQRWRLYQRVQQEIRQLEQIKDGPQEIPLLDQAVRSVLIRLLFEAATGVRWADYYRKDLSVQKAVLFDWPEYREEKLGETHRTYEDLNPIASVLKDADTNHLYEEYLNKLADPDDL